MIQMVILMFIALAMGKVERPAWGPAVLASLVSIATILFVLLRRVAPTADDDLSLIGTVVLYFATAYLAYAMGRFWKRKEDAGRHEETRAPAQAFLTRWNGDGRRQL